MKNIPILSVSKKLTTRFLLGAALLTFSAGNLAAESVSINFGSQSVTIGSAGAILVEAENWNNVGGNATGTSSNLQNDTGAATGITVEWAASTQWGSSATTTTGNGQLTKRYLDDNNLGDGMGAKVVVSNIDYFVSNAYVIVASDAASFTSRPVNVNGTWYTGTTGGTEVGTSSSSWSASNWVDSTDALVEGTGGSYLSVSNLTGSTITIRGASSGTGRGPIAGVQIENAYSGDLMYFTGGNTWDNSTSVWKINNDGSAQAWGTGADQVAVFAAGDAAVALDGAQSADGIWVKNGNVTLNSGTLNLTGVALLRTNSEQILTVNSALASTGGVSIGGEGKTVLSGDNSGFAGGFTVNDSATLIFGNDNAAGTGAIAVKSTTAGVGTGGTFDQSFVNKFTTDSVGTLLLAADSSANLDLTNVAGMSLGATGGTREYSGALTVGDSGYKLGGGDGTIKLTGALDGTKAFALTGKVELAQSSDFTISGAISGTGALIKSGTNTLTLTNTAANTYTGGTVIDGGTLSLGTGGTGSNTSNAAALGTGSVTINSGGTLKLWIQNSTTFNIANAISINGGKLLSHDGTYNINGGVTVGELGATFAAVYSGKNLILNSVVSGTGDVTITAGGGTVIFAADNTYSGTTTVSTGTLQIGNGGNTGTLGTNTGTVSVASGATLAINRTDFVTFANDITGAGNVTKTGGGTLVLTGNNSYTGTTNVNGGILQVNNFSELGTGGGDISLGSGGTLKYTGENTTLTRRLTGGGGALEIQTGTTITHTGKLTSGNITKTGEGTLILSGTDDNSSGRITVNAGTVYLEKTNGKALGYETDALVLNAGTVVLNGSGTQTNDQIWDGSQVRITGGTLDMNGRSETIQRLDGTGGTVKNDTGTLVTLSVGNGTTNSSVNSSAFAGEITGNIALTKTGTGTLTLSGANTYTGATAINAGTFNLTGSVTSNVTIANNANLSGDGTITGDLTFAGDNTFTTGAKALEITGTLTDTGTITVNISDEFINNYAASQSENIITFNNTAGTGNYILGTIAASSGDSRLTFGTTGDTLTKTANAVTIAVTGNAADLIWAGDGSSNTWQLKNGIVNWTTSAADKQFHTADKVTFNDTATEKTVTITGNVAPGSVTIDNTAGNDYTFTGDGAFAMTAGSTLTKTGTGTATINNTAANTFNTVNITGGTLAINNGQVNTFNDDITITGGTFSVTNSTDIAMAAGKAIIINNGGIFDALAGGWGNAMFTNANTAITINTGGQMNTSTHSLGSSGNLPAVTVNGGTWQLSGEQYINANYFKMNGGEVKNSDGVDKDLRINAGTVQIGASAGGSVISTRITLYGDTVFEVARGTSENDLLITANIEQSGTRSLTKTGDGTLTLTGTSSYTGATTISAGTLQIGNGGNTGTLAAGAIINNANLAFNRSDSHTVANIISGNGTLTQNGTGTTILTGTNTYSGGTVINAGTLQVNNATNATGTILGTGTVTINAGGTLLLTHGSDNVVTVRTLTNNIIVDGGKIHGMQGQQHITGTVDVLAGGATFGVYYDKTKHLVFDGEITGSGAITIEKKESIYNDGKVIFSANNDNYSGTITIKSGTYGIVYNILQIGDGGTTGTLGTGNVTNNGQLHFNRSNAYEVANTITGSGSVTQLGTGTTILTGTNTYAGATTVNAGTLRIEGSITSDVTVTGGTLGGSGTITGDITVATGGTLAPGSSSGTLAVNGDVTLAAGAQLLFEIDGLGVGQRDLLNFTGSGNTLTFDDGAELYVLINGSVGVEDFNAATIFIATGATLSGWDTLNNGNISTNLNWTITIDSFGVLQATAIPEPSTYALLGAAVMGGLVALRRRRKN